MHQKELTFITITHGPLIDDLTNFNLNDWHTNNNWKSISSKQKTILINNFDKIKGLFNQSTHKLLIYAISQFLTENKISKKNHTIKNLEVSFGKKSYIALCGYDTKNGNIKIKKALKSLAFYNLTWICNTKTSEQIQRKKIVNDYLINRNEIRITFSEEFANYLLGLPLTKIPIQIFKIDERNNNAYTIAYKLSIHFSMISNKNFKTNNKIRIKNLLNNCNYPSIYTVRQKSKSWNERIKNPFEKALDYLKSKNILQEWNYDISIIPQDLVYENWIKSLIIFEIKDLNKDN